MVLSDNTYPPDIRVEKEADALLKAGHEVFLVCSMAKGQDKNDDVKGLKVHRINIRQSLLIGHLLFQIIAFLKLLVLIRKFSIDHIHVHDLPLAIPAILAGKISDRKVVLDLHENYPAMMALVSPNIVVSILKKIEWFSCYHTDKIIVVVDEAKDRLADMGITKGKIHIVSNYADIEKLKHIDDVKKPLNKPALVYSGGLSPHRGMDTVLKALAKVNKERNVYLYIVGGSELELRRSGLNELISDLGLGDSAVVTGWLPFEESIGYVRGSDICLIPHLKNPHTDATMPHKIFQFMYLEKPILVSDVTPLKNVVDETKCGLVFESGNDEDLADKIIQALNIQEQWRTMGENGKKAVIDKYNWKMESEKLIKLYEDIEKDDSAL